MPPEDSLFEQIMKIKRLAKVQPKPKKKSIQPKINKKKSTNKYLSELDIKYNKLIAESVDRTISHERVIQIKKELTEIRRLKRGEK